MKQKKSKKGIEIAPLKGVSSLRLFFNRAYCFNRFKLPILFLLIVEALLIGWWSHSSRLQYRAERGYLVKNGKQYIVFWINDEHQQSMIALDNLKSAVQFVRDDLELEVATETLNPHPLESIWMKTNLNNYYLYWKPADSGYLNRLTFVSKDEAETFRDWFNRGAYSTSPIGHSIALKPQKKN